MIFVYPDGATPLNHDEVQGLLLLHIRTRAELDRWEQENIIEAEDSVFKRQQKPFHFIQEKPLNNYVGKLYWDDYRSSALFFSNAITSASIGLRRCFAATSDVPSRSRSISILLTVTFTP